MIAVLPMAGRGSRFAGSKYDNPKPFISVNGVPMYSLAVGGLEGLPITKLVIVTLQEHADRFDILQLLPEHWAKLTTLVAIPEVTQGQLCTVLEASKYIDNEEEILIVSSDTIVESGLAKDIKEMPSQCRGLISVADMPGDRWSFAKTDENGKVVEVAEKVRISNHASTGLYYFKSGKEFCSYGRQMIINNERTKGEFFVIPVYQKFIEEDKWIGVSKASKMYDLGTPGSLEAYLSSQ